MVIDRGSVVIGGKHWRSSQPNIRHSVSYYLFIFIVFFTYIAFFQSFKDIDLISIYYSILCLYHCFVVFLVLLDVD